MELHPLNLLTYFFLIFFFFFYDFTCLFLNFSLLTIDSFLCTYILLILLILIFTTPSQFNLFNDSYL